MSKYTVDKLLSALRLFSEARNKALEAGFTDNGGAIHSAERIVDILGLRLCYPHLSHINNLKSDPAAEISKKAYAARERGEKLMIEHVMPRRAFARKVLGLIDDRMENTEIIAYVKNHYRLVVLTAEETVLINRQNRSEMTEDRIEDAGIELF